MTTYKIEISIKTILLTLATLLSIWVLYQIRSIVVLFFISFILATAITPIANSARRKNIPIIIPMILVYISVILTLSLVVASLLPAVVEQSGALIKTMPIYFNSLESNLHLDLANHLSSNYLPNIPNNLFKIATGLFSNMINIFAVFFVTYYIVLERPHLHHYLTGLFGKGNKEQQAEALVLAIEKAVGGWIRGELTLMLIIGLMTYIGLILLGIPYALPLAVLAGILEMVPNLGPTLAAIPAIFMGLTISPIMASGALVVSFLIQQLENNLIVPRVMQSAVGIQPLVTIFILLTGFTLAGITGTILAMPIYLIFKISYQHLTI